MLNTKKIKFEWPYQARSVNLVCSFHNWNEYIPMEKNQSNVWTVEIDLPVGTHQYKFLVDDINWYYDVLKPSMNDGFNQKNNVIRVKEDNSIVTIVHISDTHSNFHKKIPDGDILIHSGDFSIDGHPGEYEMFDNWLGNQPHTYKFVILGNHDLDYMIREEKLDPIIEAPKRLKNATILSSELVEVLGLKIYGVQWYHYHNWEYSYKNENFVGKEEWYKIPNDTDILITHGPPYGYLDGQYGSYSLAMHVKDVKPKLHLFGHIHFMNGQKKVTWDSGETTLFVNSSAVSEHENVIINEPSILNISVF